MTQEEKQLLLKELCARLPYGVKFILSGNNIYTMKGIDLIVTDECDLEYAITARGIEPTEIEYIKPYLRPMSSMTEKERREYLAQCDLDDDVLKTPRYHGVGWLNAHHFDYHGLIPLGLGIDCTGLNIYENEKSI